MRKQVTIYGTSADFVYADLRAKIICKQLSPGTRLPEITVARQLKVSRTPVRDALRRLAAEGLVTIIPNHGAKVTQLTAEEIRGAYAVRQQLELMSVAEATEKKLDKKTAARIMRIIANERRALIREDTETRMDLNNAFHKAIAEASKNPILVEFVENILLRTNVHALFFAQPDEDNDDNIRMHEEILQAILANDKELAEALMKNHLRLALSMLTIPEEQAVPQKKRGKGRRRGAATDKK